MVISPKKSLIDKPYSNRPKPGGAQPGRAVMCDIHKALVYESILNGVNFILK